MCTETSATATLTSTNTSSSDSNTAGPDGAPCLFIGPRMSAINTVALLHNGITHVLSCTGQHPALFRGAAALARSSSSSSSSSSSGGGGSSGSVDKGTERGVETKLLQLEDTPDQDIISCFDEAVRWMDDAIQQGGRVLVFCQFGRLG